jgi:hypothetical protein
MDGRPSPAVKRGQSAAILRLCVCLRFFIQCDVPICLRFAVTLVRVIPGGSPVGMLSWNRLSFPLLILAVGAALPLQEARAAAPCAGLPPSKLQIFDITAPDVQVIMLPAEEIERYPQGDLASRHTFMLSQVRVVTWFEITHRIIPREDGLVCDAPAMVRVGFGFDRRTVLLARPAAKDVCVRQAMLDHEAAHIRALGKVVDDFIDRRTADITRDVTALKATPAPDAAIAKTRWETGLRALVAEARRKLLEDLRAAITKDDQPAALAALENACGGSLRKLEGGQG